ncbi:hypothetical protein [Roseibium aestuarii]|uniref:DUF3618 domain-containing protein n=1 Tax=Roseibium aestuarii TaxID=2600299 RepID=A0ABW4JR49_9HYPH|nr:hypothetical protein [Roseibium aestuarii]
MAAQNELETLFAELDRRTDLALAGLRQVRETPKLSSLKSPFFLRAPLVLTAALVSLLIVWFSRGAPSQF